MRQFLVRLFAFVIVLLVVFGLYRLLTIQPLSPSDFFAQPGAEDRLLVIFNVGESGAPAAYTLEAFEAARGRGADGLYLPLHLTRDGELVVLGSPLLAATTGARGRVGDATLADLQSLQVVSLRQVLAAFPQMRVVAHVVEPSLPAVAALLQAVDGNGARERLLAVVDDQQLAEALREQAPDLATAYTSGETSAFLTTYGLRLTPFYRAAAPALVLDAEQVSSGLVRAAHSQGVSVVVLEGAPEGDAVEDWFELGVDAVIVNQ